MSWTGTYKISKSCRTCYPMSRMDHLNMSDTKRASPQESCSSDSDSKGKRSSSGPRRRPSRAGTRSVTTLTAAQLERKRANDREAQRAIRQRTKDHIEQLERQVAELSAVQNEDTRLMDAFRRIEELKHENNSLRAKLSHALASLSAENAGAWLYPPMRPRRRFVTCCRPYNTLAPSVCLPQNNLADKS